MLRDLANLRLKNGLSIRKLATKSGVSKSTIQNIESDKNIPNLETVCALAAALDTTPGSLCNVLCAGEAFVQKAYRSDVCMTTDVITPQQANTLGKETLQFITVQVEICYVFCMVHDITIEDICKIIKLLE